MAEQPAVEKGHDAASAEAPAPAASTSVQPPARTHWSDAAYEGRFNDEDNDGDSALGSEGASTTASLSASILQYREYHGRRYHAEQGSTEYWGPNDERQNESMDINHHVYSLFFEDKLYHSPLPEKVANVLDIGTGTGIWAIDFADAHPEAQVIGTDISPTQSRWVPPNCRFEVEDATLEWTFPPDKFDFVHFRVLVGAIGDWDALLKQAYKVTAPGGWVESFEVSIDLKSDDGTVTPGMALADWAPIFCPIGEKLGKPFDMVEKGTIIAAFKNAGFTDIKTKREKIPIGGWPKDEKLRQVGMYSHFAVDAGMEGYAVFMLTQVAGWSIEQVQLYIATARKELRSKKVHCYYDIEIVCGRKPDQAS